MAISMKTPVTLKDIDQWLWEDDIGIPQPLYKEVLVQIINNDGLTMQGIQNKFPTIPRTTLSDVLQFWIKKTYLYKTNGQARGRGRPEVLYYSAFDWEDKPDMIVNKEN